jgi:hypothetical protein
MNIFLKFIVKKLRYSLAATLLSVFWSKTSVNGVLGRGQMFLFSTAQIRSFLHLVDDWTPNGRKLLDLGAGDGRITSQFSSYFAEIFVTDASSAMQWRLAQRGFTGFDRA